MARTQPARPAARGKATTRADEIVNLLAQGIIAKTLAPGMELDEFTLARDFGVSRTPIREALRQLASSGLVELRPHRAARVAVLDDQRLSEMFDIMAELEALCAQRASHNMTTAERHALEDHHRSMGDMVRSAEMGAYRAANMQFHALIYAGAHNGYLRDLALSTRERLAPHRGAQLEAPARLARSYAEHEAIVIAILQADAARAAQAMRQHLSVTQMTLKGMQSAHSE